MKTIHISFTVLLIAWLLPQTVAAQVGIGFEGPLEPGAILQIESDNQGVMLPNVALTSRTDNTTITGGAVEGLLIYNTAVSGTGNNSVSPGYYYYDGSEWVRIYKDGYSEHFMQTDAVRANNTSSSYTLTNLDQDIVAPYTGTYQIIVTAYYASASADNTSEEAVGYCSVWLEIDRTKVAETFITSSTKLTPSQFQALGQQGMLIHNVDLVEGNTYEFRVRAREWEHYNMDQGSLAVIAPGNWGFWGTRTDIYAGNSTSYDFGQKATMTITLLRQF